METKEEKGQKMAVKEINTSFSNCFKAIKQLDPETSL